jgi:PTH1 family peptidyl-tRNA hydrolase
VYFKKKKVKIFCFLGNIGDKYVKTRHNAGFLFADFLQKKWNTSEWKKEKKFFGEISEGLMEGEKIIFLKPHTFMNLSGKALLSLMQFYKLSPEDVVLLYDDKDLDFSVLRFRKTGSAGGHNGVKDVIRVLGAQGFARWKIGVDSKERAHFPDTAAFVLSNFSPEEQELLQKNVFVELEEKVREWLQERKNELH